MVVGMIEVAFHGLLPSPASEKGAAGEGCGRKIADHLIRPPPESWDRPRFCGVAEYPFQTAVYRFRIKNPSPMTIAGEFS
jgi:hypothetical protein